ncbi:unnamed protein product [Fusarium equiseti]|uniref:Fungal N-terminal domain-containing protein n=1 Tax=Fusarium equiseti TaxID=61235 RepID=A0A8J2JB94_FUSEQ|nr:unnamed protein product [Fusarium equiseti]
MAELALAIIPIGLKTCSALLSYLSGLKDRDDALARLMRQAESLEGCFRLLDASFKQGHLDPARYRIVPHIIVCLKNCEEGLNDLKEFEQTQKTQNRLEHSLQKLRFPLRKAHLEELESILDRLCQPLSLAIQNLQLEIDLANSSALSLNTTNVQQATNAVSNLQTAVGSLTVPVDTIQSSLPLLQDSVDNFIPQIVPQINLIIESRLQAQMENIRQALQEVEVAAIWRHNATNELLSQLTTPNDGRVSVVAKLASKPSAIAELGSYISTCSCLVRKSSTSKHFRFGSFLFRDNIVTSKPHMEGCPLYVANLKSSRRRTLSFTGIIKSLNSAIQLTFCSKTGAGGFAINPSLMYFGVVDIHTAPAFQVLILLGKRSFFALQKRDQELCFKVVLRKLQEVFSSGRARPTDIDQHGQSLLHIMSQMKTERRLVDSSAGELDFYAIEVDRMLYRKHFTSFDRMSTVIYDDIGHLSTEVKIYQPVYLSLASSEDASIFFDLGFLDINHLPVSTEPDAESLHVIENFMFHVTPQYATWLNTHLPRLWEWTNQYSILEGFDFILADITGRYFTRYCLSNMDKALAGLVSTIDILDNDAIDKCSCLCTPGGCNPFDVIARWLARTSNLLMSIDLVGLVLKHYGESLQQNQLICLVRQATFEALGMTHTCVNIRGLSLYTLPQKANKTAQEDIEASVDDLEKMEYLNGLVAEFEDFMLGRSESLEDKTPAGSAIPSVHSDEKNLGSRALVFWNETWPDRVEEIKKSLEETWDPDFEILNDLGISLWFEEEEDDTTSQTPETSEDRHARLLDDFLTKLDKI